MHVQGPSLPLGAHSTEDDSAGPSLQLGEVSDRPQACGMGAGGRGYISLPVFLLTESLDTFHFLGTCTSYVKAGDFSVPIP